MSPLLFSLLLACGNENEFHIVADNGSGDVDGIAGWVCDPDTGSWLEGATVYTHLFRDNVLYDTRQTLTDEDGSWNLSDLPPDRTYLVYVQYQGQILEELSVSVPSVGGVTLETPSCAGGTGRLAVVSGNYDDLEKVLKGLGYNYEAINGNSASELAALLSDPANLAVYDAVLFSGGHIEEDVLFDSDGSGHQAQVDAVFASLRAYVQGGGVIIATDWSYDLIEGGWPDKVDFYGDDLVPDAAQMGEPGLVDAEVLDAALSSATGLSDAEIRYDLPTFPLMVGVSEDTTVYLRGTLQMRSGETVTDQKGPMTIGFSDGDGQVIFSNWRFDANAKTEGWEIVKELLREHLESEE